MSKTQPAEILTKPSLAALSLVLRNREMWPEGFEWDYQYCSKCAMGLAFRLGWAVLPDKTVGWPTLFYRARDSAASAFGLSEHLADKFFQEADEHCGVKPSEVTPEHVADLIDAHLAREV